MSNQNIYFIDGDELIYSVEPSAQKFSAGISSDLDLQKFSLAEEDTTRIIHQAWENVVRFYNKDRSAFEDFRTKVGINLWFFLNFRLYYEYRNYKIRIATINAFLEQHSNGVVITSDLELKDKIDPLYIMVVRSKKKSNLRSKLIRIGSEFSQILKTRKPQKKLLPDTVIISHASDHIDGKNKRFHSLEKEYGLLPVRNIFNMSEPLRSLDKLFQDNLNSDWIVKDYLISTQCIKDQLNLSNSIKELLVSLGKDETHARDIFRLIKKHIASYRIFVFYYKAWAHYFTDSGIKNILISGESSTQSRSIVEAAKFAGINVYGFQHGMIHDLHPAYMHGKYEGEIPLPTRTFVWGSHYEDLLLKKGGYRKDQVRSIGRLPIYMRTRLNSEIDRSRKVIVYCTQPQRNLALRKQQLLDVLCAAKSLKDTHQLILRPHPRERDDQYFKSIGGEIEYDDFLIDRTSDLLSHFECCDYLVTSFSTVGLEYIPYSKPLIVLDYLKEDLAGYIAEGVGVPAYSQSDLIDILSTEYIQIDESAYQDYLNRYYTTGDKVVEEVRREIESRL